jgi:hypothetical protein
VYDDLGGGLAISLCSEQLHSTTSSEIVKLSLTVAIRKPVNA